MIYVQAPACGLLVRKVNRFLAQVTVEGKEEWAHIPNSGRLAELMIPGAEAILDRASNPARKTPYTLKALRHKGRWVCIDSAIPNALAERMARAGALPCFIGYTQVKREHTMGAHRFDLRLDGPGKPPMIVEVKSVTLVRDGAAMFPDAPTERGASHVRTLAAMEKKDFARLVLFVIQRPDAAVFRPNRDTDPEFCDALLAAARAGVMIHAVRCSVSSRSISPLSPIPIEL